MNESRHQKGEAFVSQLATIFEANGFEVLQTGDRSGLDLFLRKENQLYLAEAKAIYNKRGFSLTFRKRQMKYLFTLCEFLGGEPFVVFTHSKIENGQFRIIDNKKFLRELGTSLRREDAFNNSIPLKSWLGAEPGDWVEFHVENERVTIKKKEG